jgi:5,10-methylenetetrahydromethanopterin reductase
MRIAVQSGLVNRGRVDAVLAEIARAADLGLATYWAPNLTGQDALTVLAVAAREIAGIGLGTAVTPIPLRPPFALAQQAATVQEVAGGRLTLGIGPSHEVLVTKTFGLPWSRPLAVTRAYLEELTRIVTGGLLVVPAEHAVPVLVGAVNPGMAELAAERAAGVITWAAGAGTVRQVMAPAMARSVAGDAFRIVTVLPVCVTADPAAAREQVQRVMGPHDRYPSYQKVLAREGARGVADLAVVGSEADVAARLDELAEAGTTEFAGYVLAPDRADADRTWDFLARRAADG